VFTFRKFTQPRDTIWASLAPLKPEMPEEVAEKIRKGKVKAARERVREKRQRSLIKRDRSAQDHW
jgi:hypothetical protein